MKEKDTGGHVRVIVEAVPLNAQNIPGHSQKQKKK